MKIDKKEHNSSYSTVEILYAQKELNLCVELVSVQFQFKISGSNAFMWLARQVCLIPFLSRCNNEKFNSDQIRKNYYNAKASENCWGLLIRKITKENNYDVYRNVENIDKTLYTILL